MSNLHAAWDVMKKRVAANDLMSCLALIAPGKLVNAPQEVRKTEVSQYIASIFRVLGDFEIGKAFLRAKFLHPLRHKKVAPSQPPVGYVTDEKQAPATKILRTWAIAVTPAARAYAYKQAGSKAWRTKPY